MKSAQEVLDSQLEGYDALLDGGTVEKGIESTIVSIEGKPKILREGAIKSREVSQLIGRILTSLYQLIDLGKKMHKTKFLSCLIILATREQSLKLLR